MNESPPLARRFFRLAVPNILSNLMVPLAGLVDVAMLGHLAELRHLAGVALGAILFEYVYWSFGFLRMGTTGLVAQAVGSGEPDEGLTVAARGTVIGLAAAGFVLLLQVPLRELGFQLLSGSVGVKEAGRAYFDARIWGAPAALTNLVILGWLLGTERSRRALVVAVIGHGCNIGLDLLFIGVFGWGAAGAGWATAASQYVMLLFGLWSVRAVVPAGAWTGLRGRVLDRRSVRSYLGLSGDILVRTLALVSTFAVFTNLAAGMGTLALAATAVLKNVVNLAAFLIDGFAFATESLAGIFHGAGEIARLRRLLALSAGASVATGFVFALLFWLFPGALLGLLTDHPDALELMREHVIWLFPVLFFGSLAYVLDGYFIGLAAGRTLSVTMLIAALVGFGPIGWWAARAASLNLLWLALSTFMVARVVTLGVCVPATFRPRAR